MIFDYQQHLVVQGDIDVRRAVMDDLAQRAREASAEHWNTQLAAGSLTLTSKDRKRIVKIDAYKVYTLDARQSDGTYKSSRFPCKSVDEAWSMASQVLSTYRPPNAIH